MKKLPLQRLKQDRNEPVMISLKSGSDYSCLVLKKPLFNDGLSPLLHCVKLIDGEWQDRSLGATKLEEQSLSIIKNRFVT